tara:strand:- start:1939 stop:2079 length:141 start_codon:yes stop_codon:yes gene_type:complete
VPLLLELLAGALLALPLEEELLETADRLLDGALLADLWTVLRFGAL